MSFSGTSIASGNPSSMFAWEDLTRASIPGNPFPSDNAFNDLIFGVEGVAVFQPPQINCSADILVGNDPGQCAATVTYTVTATGVPDPVVTCVPPSGSVFLVGTTAVTCTASNAAGITSCTFNVVVADTEAPVVAVQAATNPSGNNVPNAGQNPRSGQNPDGFYQLLASDNCDANPLIYVRDSASAFVAGPFASGDIVKITQAPGATPSVSPMTGAVVAHIKLKGDALVYAVDAVGNVSAAVNAFVPPPPQ
jgi:hypothetical protein